MKRIFALLMALVITLSLAACSGSNTANAPAENTLTWQEQYDLGLRYLSEGNYEEAIIAFTAAIEIDPKNAGALSGRGQAYVLSGETAENLSAALADFEAALAADELLVNAWLGLADVYIRQGEYDKAMEVLQEGLEKVGGNTAIADKIAEMESGSFTDSAGNTRRMNHYDSSGTLIWYHIYTYNRDGKKTSATSYDASESQTGQVTLEYDLEGNNTVSYNYGSDDGVVGRIENRCDGNGNQIEQFYYSPDGALECRYVNAYDANGDMIRREI
ncbi:MAG: tetratricopeptide repeat protein, partial [Clostridium sp.]|nr:tetratricopeptide repeat protein [Clostridium sp.]